jgi:hypothetical protein
MEVDTCPVQRAAGPPRPRPDYQRYGIAKGEIAAWEDGFRTRPGGPGTFEWWYFDAVLDDGSTLVINFMVKDIRGGRGIKQPASPVVTFLTVDGQTRTLTGTGYHDHNWGDAPMPQLIHHWYWARAEAGSYCVIASDITAERKYGHTQVPIFMLAKDGKIMADDSSLVRFEKTGEHPDPVTGKPVADITVYDYDATAHGGEHYRVTFRRENTIVQTRMIESVRGLKRVLARIAGFDGAYMRFTGHVTVERIGSDPVRETVTAPALWELMYFGKTTA